MSLDEAIKQFNTILKKRIILKYEFLFLNCVREFEQHNYVLTEVEFDNFINSIIKGGNNAYILNASYSQSKTYIIKYLLSNGQLTPEHFIKICKCYNQSTKDYNDYIWLFVLHKQGYKFDDEEKLILCHNNGLKTVINFLYSTTEVTVDEIKQLNQNITIDVLDMILSKLKTEPVAEDILLELIRSIDTDDLINIVEECYNKLLTKKYVMTDKVLSVFLTKQFPPLEIMVMLVENGAPITNDHTEILINRGYNAAVLYVITKGAHIPYIVRNRILANMYMYTIPIYIDLPENIFDRDRLIKQKFNECYPVKCETINDELQMLLEFDRYDDATELIQENSIVLNQEHLVYALQSGKREQIKFILDYRVIPEADTVYKYLEQCDQESINLLLQNGLNVDIKLLKCLSKRQITVENIENYNIDFEEFYQLLFKYGLYTKEGYVNVLSKDKRYQLREMFRTDSNDINEIVQFAKENSLQLDGYCFLFSIIKQNKRFKLNEKLKELGYIPPLICIQYIRTNPLNTFQQELLNLYSSNSKLSDPLKSKL